MHLRTGYHGSLSTQFIFPIFYWSWHIHKLVLEFYHHQTANCVECCQAKCLRNTKEVREVRKWDTVGKTVESEGQLTMCWNKTWYEECGCFLGRIEWGWIIVEKIKLIFLKVWFHHVPRFKHDNRPWHMLTILILNLIQHNSCLLISTHNNILKPHFFNKQFFG